MTRWGAPEEESWPSAIRAFVAALIVAVCFVILLAWTAVDAGEPTNRCDACRLGTPRPEPTVVGVGLVDPFATPAPTLPPTDTAP
jgi:hypothetical protein